MQESDIRGAMQSLTHTLITPLHISNTVCTHFSLQQITKTTKFSFQQTNKHDIIVYS